MSRLVATGPRCFLVGLAACLLVVLVATGGLRYFALLEPTGWVWSLR